MTASGDVAKQVARTARVLAAAGLVQAFGHVSARLSAGEFAISSTAPLHRCRPEDVRELELDSTGETVPLEEAPVHAFDPDAATGGGTVPLEAPMHAAIYAARPDVGAICRFHGVATAAWSTRESPPPRLHGLGLMAGAVACHPGSDLITDADAAGGVAAALGDGDCVILRANGALATGADLGRAAVRAFFLEERCRVALEAGEGAAPLSEDEIGARSRWSDAEAGRAWTWLVSLEP